MTKATHQPAWLRLLGGALLALVLAISLSATTVSAESHGKAAHEKPAHGKDTHSHSAKKEDSHKKKGVEDEKEKSSQDLFTRSLRVVLVLDSSRSMQYTDPKKLRAQGAKLFIRLLRSGDEVAILRFDSVVENVLPFTAVTPQSIEEIDKAIDGMPAEGNFTDLEAATTEALTTLAGASKGRMTPAVVLLSDGKLDAHPSRGTTAQLTSRLLDEDLPQYVWQSTRLFTIALGTEVDAALLENMAAATGGRSWAAPDPKSVLEDFSELILALKTPYEQPKFTQGFLVDPSVTEATFYFAREDQDTDAVLSSPNGEKLTVSELPSNVRWFKGEHFEIVTIAKPTAGRWRLAGLADPEENASLLSKLGLKVEWPEGNHQPDKEVRVTAMLVNDGNAVTAAGLKEVTAYAYRISRRNGEFVASGDLNDLGEDGDKTGDDGVYSAQIKLAESGDFSATIIAASPTFSREESKPYIVKEDAVTLTVREEEEHGSGDTFIAHVSKELSEVKGLKVRLVARAGEEESETKMERSSEDPRTFELHISELDPGEYEIIARASAKTKNGKKLSEESAPLHYTVVDLAELNKKTGVAALLDHLFGLMFVLFGLVLALFMWKRYVSSFVVGRDVPDALPPYAISRELEDAIAAVRARASTELRAPDEEELALFAEVKDAFGEPKPHTNGHLSHAETPEETPAAAETQEQPPAEEAAPAAPAIEEKQEGAAQSPAAEAAPSEAGANQ